MSERSYYGREKCQAMVGEPPGYWHSHRCPNRARFVTDANRLVCGIHKRSVRFVEAVDPPNE